MASTPIDEWKKIAAYHRAALEKAEAQIKQLEKPVEVPLTDEEMKQRVIAMEGRTAYKYSWKRVVTNDGLIDNVSSILNDCYDFLCDKEESGVTNADEMGIAGSLKWHLFTLKVIKYLKERGSFHNESTRDFDNFEDTAGGCDEVTQEAAIFLLNNPDWKPAA